MRIRTRVKVIIVLVVILITGIIIDMQLRPLIKSVASTTACTVSTDVINRVVSEELMNENVEYKDIVNIERAADGKILAINTNAKLANLLKSNISAKVQREISELETRKVLIPLGTLTGTEILNGRGPNIPLKITMSGNIVTELKSNFFSAGINQTNHQIFLNVSTKIFALIPGYPVNTAIETNVLVTETVIVGEIPRYYSDKNPSQINS